MDITLDALEALEAIAQAGSFGGAAERLHKAQSAVSYAVKQLEDRLGVTLFDRSGYRARLTDEGAAVLQEGAAILARARSLQAMAGQLRGGFEARLEIVVDGVLPMEPLLDALRTLSAEGVPTHVQLKVEYLGGVLEAFEQDRADLMLVKDVVQSPALVAHALPPLEMLLVAAHDHPLCQGRSRLPRSTLRDHVELTIHDSARATHGRDTHFFGGARVFYLGDFHTKREALRGGLGFGWLPGHLAEEDLQKGRLARVNVEGETRTVLHPALVHPVDRPLGRTGTRMRELLCTPLRARAAANGRLARKRRR